MRRIILALLVIVVAGGALRFDAASEPSAYQSKDEESYAMIARGLVSRHIYGNPGMEDPVHWVPGAPVMFAAAYRLDGRVPPNGKWDVPAAYNWQALVGTLTILAAFALGLLLAGPLTGLLAAAVVAFYPPLISSSRDLLSEPLGALLATSALAVTVWAVRDPGRRRWRAVLAGVLLGLTVLTRADLALLPLIGALGVAAAAWRVPTARRDRAVAALRSTAPLVAALLVVVLPWTIYASTTAGTFVPLSNGGGSNLFVGTHLPGDGTIFGTKRMLADETRRRFPEHKRGTYAQLRQRDVIRAVASRRPELTEEAALKAEGMANLRRYAWGRPIDFSAMMARKVWRLWGGYSVGTQRNRRAPVMVYHLGLVLVSFAGLLVGLLVTRRRVLWLPAAALAYITLLNAVLVSESRHNLTLIPVLASVGIGGWVLAARHLRAIRRPSATSSRTATPVPKTATPPLTGAASQLPG